MGRLEIKFMGLFYEVRWAPACANIFLVGSWNCEHPKPPQYAILGRRDQSLCRRHFPIGPGLNFC